MNIRAERLIKNGIEGTTNLHVHFVTIPVFTFQAVVSGNPTAATLLIEGSLDNNLFHELVTHQFTEEDLAHGGVMFHLVNKPVSTIQITVAELSGGTNPRMDVYGTGIT